MFTRRPAVRELMLGGLALSLAALLPAPAPSQEPPAAPRIAVIDTERVLLNSAAGKAVLADLKKAQEQKEAEIRAQQQQVKDLQTRLEAARAAQPDQVKQLEAELEAKMAGLRRFQEDATRELAKRRDDALADIDRKVMPIIDRAGKEGRYTLIFRKFESGLIYADDAVDITQEIIRRLDEARPASQ